MLMEFPAKLNSKLYQNLKSLMSTDASPTTTAMNDDKGLLYGILTVLGHSKAQPHHFELRRRPHGNGVVKVEKNLSASRETLYQTIEEVKPATTSGYKAVYQMFPNRREVVQYRTDPNYDLIQIGRVKRPNVDHSLEAFVSKSSSGASEVSRFACRIVADRSDPTNVRIFAAGFDDSLQIFLGENAHKWYNSSGEPDGFTTNGVRMANPIVSDDGSVECHWVQLSVDGNLYPLVFGVKAPMRGSKLPMTNQLIDGTLIDLSGVTLLFRFVNDVSLIQRQSQLTETFAKVQRSGMRCPISLSCLQILDESDVSTGNNNKHSPAHVYTTCGHVQGCYQWGTTELNSTVYTCCLCRQTSTSRLSLRFAKDPQIHIDTEEDLQYCFNPCGHVVSKRTANFWSQIPQPNRHTGGFTHNCPFCKTQLEQIPYIRLLFENYQSINAGA